MDVLLSNEMTLDRILRTNAPERRAGEVEWSAVAWPLGSVVTRASIGRVYKAAYEVPSGGVPPEENIANARLPYWVDMGLMNQRAMFDNQMRTQTVGPDGENLEMVVRPGAITDIWLAGLDNATAVDVVIKDKTDGEVIYQERRELAAKVASHWDWWFAPFAIDRDASFTGIPAYRDCEVTITFETGQSGVAVGMLSLGKTENLGCTEWGVDATFQRYVPQAARNAWGPEQMGGVIAKDITYTVFVDPDEAPRVDLFTKKAMNQLAVYVPSGSPRLAGIRVFGEMISARMGYPVPNYVPLEITIREFL